MDGHLNGKFGFACGQKIEELQMGQNSYIVFVSIYSRYLNATHHTGQYHVPWYRCIYMQ